MQVQEFRAVRNPIDVALFSQVAGERSYVTNFHDSLETNILLDAKLEVVDCRRMEARVNCLQRGCPDQGRADEGTKLVNVAEIDSQIALKWRIADQVATRRAAAEARTMVSATHSA